jgi:MerR family transcriptional regulator/heat shock protein HspR
MRLPIDDPHAPWFTIGQVAAMLSVQAAFLRRIDAEQVVQPARSDGGQRRYSRHEIGQVERVVRLVDEGLTLEGIRRLLVLEDQVADLQRQLAEERAKRAG